MKAWRRAYVALMLTAVMALAIGCTTAVPATTAPAIATPSGHTVVLSDNGMTVTVEDPASVISGGALSLGFESVTNLDVSNPTADDESLQLSWITAMCAPGGKFRLSPQGAGWLLEVLTLQVAPSVTPGNGVICAGGPITLTVRLSLTRPIPVAAIQVSLPPDTSGAIPTDVPASPDVVAFPGDVLGLPVHTVASALDLIAHGATAGREIAVAGYWQMAGTISCPPWLDYASRAMPDCNPEYLADSDLHLRLGAQSAGPALRPVIDDEATDPLDALSNGTRRIVAVGHAGDPRAWGCVVNPVSRCLANFFIDRVVWVEGADAGTDVVPTVYLTRGTAPRLSPQAAVAAATTALPAGVLVTVVPTEAVWAPTIDPRVRGGVQGLIWIARAITGPVDSAGTAALDEVVIDDDSGKILQRLSVASPAEYRPATVVLSAGHGNGGTYDVELTDGTIILTGSTSNGAQAPVVLEAGDYRILAWAGHAPPSNPPASACSRNIHVSALEQVSFAASFGGLNLDSGPCTWDRVPTPTPY